MEKNKPRKIELTLLGIWNILPVGTWTWFDDIAVGQLERLTGRKLGVFYYVKNDLYYACFVKRDTDALKEELEKLAARKQVAYVKKITDDYYREVKALEKQLEIAEALPVESLDDGRLAEEIMLLAHVWSRVTMQIWYAVLLDIWYPGSDEKSNLKTIIAPARDHCGHLHEKSDKIEHRMYVVAAKRLGISEREVYFLAQPEIAGMLRGKKIKKQEIQSRLEITVLSNISGKAKLYGGEEAREIMGKFEIPTIGSKESGNLKGTPACLGKVTGRARVILLDKEFPDFKEGEILVSLQTMVHYLPIMRKASAILTEFGGLTSHAAIVSRELKKPCVVGIKGLVASVKTGDLVEVDAERGIVKVIKRKAG